MSILEEKKTEIENLQSQIELTPRMKNLTNKKQGHITFLKISHKKDNRNYWWTICDCGTIEQTRADSKKEHCITCARKQAGLTNRDNQAEDLTNKRFGKLTALYSLKERKNGHIIWHCKCDCGKERDVVAGSLKSGNTKSCGCLRKETNYFTQYKINLVNQRFGYLTVLEETEERQYEKIVWKCQCDCGNIVFLNTSRLKNGNDTSCGCKKQSLGMLTIKKLLEDNNIQFKKEYTEESLNKKRFDFAIIKNNKVIRLIEFDGEQHYRTSGGWNNKENLLKTQQRDEEKNQWAAAHNIPLVRIPYWERDNITLEMILGDKYLVE